MRETALLSQEQHDHKPRKMVYGACKGPTRPRTINKWGSNTSYLTMECTVIWKPTVLFPLFLMLDISGLLNDQKVPIMLDRVE